MKQTSFFIRAKFSFIFNGILNENHFSFPNANLPAAIENCENSHLHNIYLTQ